MANRYAPSTSKRGICICYCSETLIYPAVCIDGNWSPVMSEGVIIEPIRWDSYRFTEITHEAIIELVKEKWPEEDSILEIADHFDGGMIFFRIHKIDYSTGTANGRAVHESGEPYYDGTHKHYCMKDFWTPEEAAAFICELCNKKLDSIFGHIAKHEEEIARKKEQGELLKERFRNHKPNIAPTLKERVAEKLNGMTTEEIAKAIGV